MLLQNEFRGVIAWVGIVLQERGCDPALQLKAGEAGAVLVRADRPHLRRFDVADRVQLSVRA